VGRTRRHREHRVADRRHHRRAAWANENGIRHQDEIPTGRFATPGEVAAAVLFLAGESSAMVNGADLRVDGGFTIR
jgi:NAD(P)-dependent dehydrogenase (short-subunit alcohol dehydrogenase family)